MKKLVVIFGVIFFAGSVFACPKITGISFEPSFEVPVGTNVTATMLIQEVLDYQIDICTWGGDFSGLEQTSGLTLSSPQTYSADASIHWSGVDENGKIVSGTDTYSQTLVAYCVNTVTEDKQVVAKGSSDTITITAGVYPAVTGDVGSFIQWQKQKDNGTWDDAGTGMSQTLDSSEVGTYYYRARAGDNDTWVVSDELTVFSLTLTNENVTVTRGVPGISATLVPSEFLPSKFVWTFTGGAGGVCESSTINAGVTLVDSNDQYTVKCKILYGNNQSYETPVANIIVNARTGWSLVPTCIQDDNPNWGDFPGGVLLGQFVNKNGSNVAITPVDSSGATIAQVTTDGPNIGYWYVKNSSYVISVHTLINRYLKKGTTPLTPPGINFYEYNKAHGVDSDKFLTAIKNHEYMGSSTGGGHYKQLTDEAVKDENNLDKNIEKLCSATVKENLEKQITDSRKTCNDEIWPISEPSGNWSGDYYVYSFPENNWMLWTGATY